MRDSLEQRRWAGGLLIAVLVLWFGLLGRPAWPDALALALPVSLFLHPAVGRSTVLGLGMAGILAGWVFGPEAQGGLALLRAAGLLWLGVHLADRAREAGAPVIFDAAEAWQAFDDELQRELARARRHEHPFVLLSAAAEGCDTALLEAKLRETLHRYAVVADLGDRVLALAPETDEGEIDGLVARIEDRLRGERWQGLRLGVARFPADAVASRELVAVADRARVAPALRAVAGGAEVVDEPPRDTAVPEA